MASQSLPGYNARVYISTDGGSTFPEIGELRDVTLTITTKEYDATSHITQGWDDLAPGNRQWSAKASALYVKADAAQAQLITAVLNGSTIKARFHPSNTASTKERFEGDCFISNFELTGPNSDLCAVSLDIRGRGALVLSAQP